MAEQKEFWRWPESNWKDPHADWKSAKYITVGIDVGSVSAQAVIMADGEIFAYGNMRTGSDSSDSAVNVLAFALDSTDMPGERVDYAVAPDMAGSMSPLRIAPSQRSPATQGEPASSMARE